MKYDKRAAIAGLAGLAAAGCASGDMVIQDENGALHYFTTHSDGAAKEMLLSKHGYVSGWKAKQVLAEKMGEIGTLDAKLAKETAEKTLAVQAADGFYKDQLAAQKDKNSQYGLTDILGISTAVVLGTALISVLASKLVKKYISR